MLWWRTAKSDSCDSLLWDAYSSAERLRVQGSSASDRFSRSEQSGKPENKEHDPANREHRDLPPIRDDDQRDKDGQRTYHREPPADRDGSDAPRPATVPVT